MMAIVDENQPRFLVVSLYVKVASSHVDEKNDNRDFRDHEIRSCGRKSQDKKSY